MSDGRRLSGTGDEWGTPNWLFQLLHEEFVFTFDAAAAEWNAKCEKWTHNGLEDPWDGKVVWLNPPFSLCEEFSKRAVREADTGKTVVVLLPVRSDREWWHHAIREASEIRFCLGRPAFVPPPDSPNPKGGNRPVFNTMVAIYEQPLGPFPIIGKPIVCPRNNRDATQPRQRYLL